MFLKTSHFRKLLSIVTLIDLVSVGLFLCVGMYQLSCDSGDDCHDSIPVRNSFSETLSGRISKTSRGKIPTVSPEKT